MTSNHSSRRLTSKDIARIAGVSQTTVSRVLQGVPNLRPETRERVLAVIKERDYHPSAAARSMKTSRTNSVAVVVARLANPLYPQLLQFLSDELHKVDLLMSVWESVPRFETRLLRSIGEGMVDGVLFATATEKDVPLLKRLSDQRPVVLLNRTVSEPSIDQISSDNLAGGKAVADYFVTNGRRWPGLITGPSEPSTIRDRERGFTERLSDRGVTLGASQRIRADDFTYQCGYQAAQTLLSLSAGIDSVFCTNDVLAIGACDGLRAMGRVIPSDVWVVGYDDIPMSGWSAISLSTMRQPLNVIAALAVQTLGERLDGEHAAPRSVLLHNDLVTRSTSG